jgi:hypothetical protein
MMMMDVLFLFLSFFVTVFLYRAFLLLLLLECSCYTCDCCVLAKPKELIMVEENEFQAHDTTDDVIKLLLLQLNKVSIEKRTTSMIMSEYHLIHESTHETSIHKYR